MLMAQWNKFNEIKPIVGKWIYLKDRAAIGYESIEIKKVYDPVDNPKAYKKFGCFECGFEYSPNEYTDKLEWAYIAEHKYLEICSCCGLEKIIHFCGKDSHPNCEIYNKALIKHKVEELSKKTVKNKVLFYWFLGIMTFLIIAFVSGFSEYFGVNLKTKLYHQVGKPIVKDISKELQDVIGSIGNQFKDVNDK